MLAHEAAPPRTTHEVFNQVPPLADYNVYEQDEALKEGLHREGGSWAEDRVAKLGSTTGSAGVIELGFLANRFEPVLKTHDMVGNRIDEVEFHPAYHKLMEISMGAETHALPWNHPRPGAHVARACLAYMMAQLESGHGCPIAMTFSGVPSLKLQEDLAREWVPRLTATEYDPRFLPASEKTSATMGMAMTEKQGGSDVRANTTKAFPLGAGGPGGEYELLGHKWFCSAPMSDMFLTLAYTENGQGLSCFLVPRWRPDGVRNPFYIQRLKNKLGNRSNASSEIEYNGTWARMVGEEGRGVPTIIEMVTHTRLECVIGSSGIMRQAVAQALHHTGHRSAFKKRLTDHPLMQNVLADLAVESEAATTMMLRLARAYDERADESQVHFARLATAVSKYWICKRAPGMVYECLECHGGNGYVEDSILPRLLREAPVNSVWEGSGNVICLDVLRAMGREPESVEAFLGELAKSKGADRRLDEFIAGLIAELNDRTDMEIRARRVVSKMAMALQGALLVQHAPPAVADAFCASRLGGEGDRVFGMLPPGLELEKIVERARPNAA